jgi:hypothetical protein
MKHLAIVFALLGCSSASPASPTTSTQAPLPPPTVPVAPPPTASQLGMVGQVDLRAQLPPGAEAVASLDLATASHAPLPVSTDRSNGVVLETLAWVTHLAPDEEGYAEPALAGVAVNVLANPNGARVVSEVLESSAGGALLRINIEWDRPGGGLMELEINGSVMAHSPTEFFAEP